MSRLGLLGKPLKEKKTLRAIYRQVVWK